MLIHIRPYQSQDQAQLVALFEAFQDHLIALDPLKRLRRLPGYGEHILQQTIADVAAHDGVFYVATDDEVVVGLVVGIITRATSDELLWLVPSVRGRITELYVRPEYRGQGIGTRLIQATEQHCVQRGCDVIRVEVFVPNHLAHRLYKKMGYQDLDIDMIKPIRH